MKVLATAEVSITNGLINHPSTEDVWTNFSCCFYRDAEKSGGKILESKRVRTHKQFTWGRTHGSEYLHQNVKLFPCYELLFHLSSESKM